jgi:hypothetical protein
MKNRAVSGALSTPTTGRRADGLTSVEGRVPPPARRAVGSSRSPGQQSENRVVWFDRWVAARIVCSRMIMCENRIRRRVSVTAADKFQTAARCWAVLVE